MDKLSKMQEDEMYEFLINALHMQEYSEDEAFDNETFYTFWNILSEKYFRYAKGMTIEVSDKVSLASFLLDILNIQDNNNTEVYEEEDLKDYDINKALEADGILQGNRSFRILWDILKNIPKITFVTEEYYIDRVYRDSYYTYYSCKHFEYSRYCKRLFLFEGNLETEYDNEILDIAEENLQKAFIGCIVIRPLETGKIGRSLLNPYYFTSPENSFIRKATYNVTMFGKRLYVDAFPYSMQDEETTSCEEITILNLLDYFSKKYAEYKYFLPSDIIDIAIKNGYERRLPTKGLDYLLISKVFMEAGFYPVLYNADKLEDSSKFKRILHYYIESGIPTAIGLEINKGAKHSIVCVGHGKVDKNQVKKQYSIPDPWNEKHHIWLIDSADMVKDYIVMDDNERPYLEYTWKEEKNRNLLGKWKPEYLMVPLYRRMFLEAADAYDICTSILADQEMGIQKHMKEVGTIDNPIVIRLFMASSRGFKKYRIKHLGKDNYDVRERYINTPFPRFVWVCELYLKEDYPDCCIGEIIVDATAAPNVKIGSVILLHYPGIVFTQLPNQKDDVQAPVFSKLQKWNKFQGYKENLDCPVKEYSRL